MAIGLSTTTVRLDDAAAMAKFLAPIENGDRLAAVLEERTPISTRAYQDEAWTAWFVESDGETVLCLTVTGITIDQAELIALECEKIQGLNERAYRDAVGRALHEPVVSQE